MTVIIPEARQQAIAAAIVTLQARGESLTNDNVYRVVGGRRGFVTAYMKAFRAQTREAQAQGQPHAASPLIALHQQCMDYDQDWADAQRELAQLTQDRAECHSHYRYACQEARRLYPLFLHALQASRLPVYQGTETVQADFQRLRNQLIALVGPEDVHGIENTPASKPWWLDAR